jgi:uncharacterized membrane protein
MTISTDLGTNLSRGDEPSKSSVKPKIVAAVLTGGGLMALGLSRRSWAGLGLAAGGAYLAYQGMPNLTAQVGSVRVAYTINRSPQELFDFLRDEKNWHQFARGVEIAGRQGDEMKLVFGRALGFELVSNCRVTYEKNGEFIAWSSLPGALEHRGVVHFRPAPGDRGTELSLAVEFKIPAGTLRRGLAMMQGQGPEQFVRENLRRMKQFLEGGEIPTTVGQSSGARGAKGSALRVLYREATQEKLAEDVRLAG